MPESPAHASKIVSLKAPQSARLQVSGRYNKYVTDIPVMQLVNIIRLYVQKPQDLWHCSNLGSCKMLSINSSNSSNPTKRRIGSIKLQYYYKYEP